MPTAAFVSFVLLTAFTPGPNNVLCMSTAIQHGFRKTLPLCAGMLAGFFLVMSFCTLATGFLYKSLPSVEPALRVIGAAYILHLAYAIYRSKANPDANRNGNGNDSAASRPDQPENRPIGFVSGMLLQCVNAKYIFYCLAALSTFVLPHYSSLSIIACFGLLLIAATSMSNLLWAFFGSAFQNVFTRHAKALNAVMALMLVYCAAALLL